MNAEPVSPFFALTRSSQASTSASTLESFLERIPGFASSSMTGEPRSLPSASPLGRSNMSLAVLPGKHLAGPSGGWSDSDADATLQPTELARARAYEAVHGKGSASAGLSTSLEEADSIAEQEPESAPAHAGMSHAFLITYFVAGGAAGATSRTVVSPLERLKIIMQVQPQSQPQLVSSPGGTSAAALTGSAASKRAYSGVWTGLAKMWREEGFAGFMRGNGINCLRIMPYSAVQFTTYEMCKTWLRDEQSGDLDVIRRLTAGAIAGITSVVSTYPLDLVRSRISIASASMYSSAKPGGVPASAVPGIWQMTTQVYREEGGLRGLYRGCVPTSIGVAPYVALNFYFYEAARKRVLPADGSEPSALAKLACGALAGSISQTLTYPLDVLRRRMQVAGMKDSAEKLGYKDRNAINAIQNIVRAEGLTGLYRGLLPNLLKVAPSIGTSFLTYEAVKASLEHHLDEHHLLPHPPQPNDTAKAA